MGVAIYKTVSAVAPQEEEKRNRAWHAQIILPKCTI